MSLIDAISVILLLMCCLKGLLSVVLVKCWVDLEMLRLERDEYCETTEPFI